MWVVIIGGVFGVVTLLLKAAIDLGSKTSRTRKAIEADLALLGQMPDNMQQWASVDDLRDRIDRQLTAYAVSDLAPPAPAAFKAKQQAEAASRPVKADRLRAAAVAKDVRLDLGRLLGLSLLATLAGSGALSWIAEMAVKVDPQVATTLASIAAAALGTAISLFVLAVSKRQQRSTLEEAMAAKRRSETGDG